MQNENGSPWNRNPEDIVEIDDLKKEDKPKDAAWDCGANGKQHQMARRIAHCLEGISRKGEGFDTIVGLAIILGGALGKSDDDEEVKLRDILEKHFQEHRELRDKPEVKVDIAAKLSEIFGGNNLSATLDEALKKAGFTEIKIN